MGQIFVDNLYEPAFTGGLTLQAMETNFATLKSNFSGISSPGNTVAGMLWMDTNNDVMKSRDAVNSTWRTQLQGSATFKVWVYSNVVEAGWILDSSITDFLIAIKGGSTYLTGGATAGSWTWPLHTLVIAEMPSHRHGPAAGSSNFMRSNPGGEVGSGGDNYGRMDWTGYTGGDGPHSHGGTTFRPAAAVGTLQYPITT